MFALPQSVIEDTLRQAGLPISADPGENLYRYGEYIREIYSNPFRVTNALPPAGSGQNYAPLPLTVPTVTPFTFANPLAVGNPFTFGPPVPPVVSSHTPFQFSAPTSGIAQPIQQPVGRDYYLVLEYDDYRKNVAIHPLMIFTDRNDALEYAQSLSEGQESPPEYVGLEGNVIFDRRSAQGENSSERIAVLQVAGTQ